MSGESGQEPSSVATVVESARDTSTEPGVEGAPDTPLRRGACVGRYIIVDQLGEGGMGVVFAAYDPELDRRIAIKLLSVRPLRPDQRAELQARLLREAQALALLSHPNVIAVYDVGTIQGDVFIAMELVEGRTLRAVLDDKPAKRDILELFVAAGRGLASAHAAGLVHRDFKPENVVVSASGRVCVLDFGLARSARAGRDSSPILAAPHEPREGEQTGRSSSNALLGAVLTEHGAVMGTPSYMAPEQLRGDDVDARADQFSFCVALYRALFDARPFPDKGRATAPAAMPPATAGVSQRVRRAVLRGLALDPAERHPSMDALLGELTATRSRQWVWWSAAALAVVLASGATYMLVHPSNAHHELLCRGAERKLEGIWDPAIGQRVIASFTAAAGDAGRPAAARAIASLDSYTSRWVAMHTEACEATQIRGEQSAAMLDLRMQCLQRDLDRVQALVHVFTSDADRSLVDRATEATRQLPSLNACANLAMLSAAVPPPSTPDVNAKVADVRRELTRIEALQYTGRYKAGAETARQAVALAKASGYVPVQAEALYLEGRLWRFVGAKDDAEARMREALKTAGEARDRVLLAKASTELLVIVGMLQRRLAEASSLADFATAAVSDAGNGDELRGQLLNNIGIVHFLELRYPEALQDWQASLASWEKALGPDHPDVLKAVLNIGSAYARLGKYSEAAAYQQRALRAQEAMLGPDHPALALSLENLGVVQDSAGDHEGALKTFARALAIDEHVHGPVHPLVAEVLLNMASAHRSLHRPADALPEIQRALAICQKVFGPDHPETAKKTITYADVLTDLGRTDEAFAAYQRALAIYEKAQSPEIPATLQYISAFELAHKQYAEAWASADRARALAEKSVPSAVANSYSSQAAVRRAEHRFADAVELLDHAIAVDAKGDGDAENAGARLTTLGDIYTEWGKHDLAVTAYEHALAYWEKLPGTEGQRGQARFALAKLVETADGPRAKTLARSAREELSGADYADLRTQVDHWLAARK